MINDNKAPVKNASKVHTIKDALMMKCKKSGNDAIATVSDLAGAIGDCTHDDHFAIGVIVRVLFNVDKMRGKHYITGEIVVGFPVVPCEKF